MIEFIVCAIMLICNLIIANEWAKYGLWQIGIQRPANTRAFGAAFVGVITFLISGLLQKYGEVEFSFAIKQNFWPVAMVFLGVPFVWLIFFRHVIMPKGQFDYNKAIIRTTFWTLQNYRPGQLLKSEGELLRHFSLANRTLRLFQKAIRTQEKGTLSANLQTVIDLETADISYNQTVSLLCPSCGMSIEGPTYVPQGATGNCRYCGAMLTAKSIGNKLYVNSYGINGLSRRVTSLNRKNIATAYEEMALLYRMMNRFDEAHKALDKAQSITESLLESDSDNKDYLQLKSLILFRHAEAYQTQGVQLQKAQKLYQECIAIDGEIGTTEETNLVQELLSQLT